MHRAGLFVKKFKATEECDVSLWITAKATIRRPASYLRPCMAWNHIQESCATEIYQLDIRVLVVVGVHNVRTFNIAVHNLLAVEVRDS
jgi:hypothetical protein